MLRSFVCCMRMTCAMRSALPGVRTYEMFETLTTSQCDAPARRQIPPCKIGEACECGVAEILARELSPFSFGGVQIVRVRQDCIRYQVRPRDAAAAVLRTGVGNRVIVELERVV